MQYRLYFVTQYWNTVGFLHFKGFLETIKLQTQRTDHLHVIYQDATKTFTERNQNTDVCENACACDHCDIKDMNQIKITLTCITIFKDSLKKQSNVVFFLSEWHAIKLSCLEIATNLSKTDSDLCPSLHV